MIEPRSQVRLGVTATHLRFVGGLVPDDDGNLPREADGKPVIQAQWGASVSKNPYFAFEVSGAKSGDVIKVSWADNLGETSSGEATLK